MGINKKCVVCYPMPWFVFPFPAQSGTADSACHGARKLNEKNGLMLRLT